MNIFYTQLKKGALKISEEVSEEKKAPKKEEKVQTLPKSELLSNPYQQEEDGEEKTRKVINFKRGLMWAKHEFNFSDPALIKVKVLVDSLNPKKSTQKDLDNALSNIESYIKSADHPDILSGKQLSTIAKSKAGLPKGIENENQIDKTMKDLDPFWFGVYRYGLYLQKSITHEDVVEFKKRKKLELLKPVNSVKEKMPKK